MKHLARWIIKHAGWVSLFGVISAGCSAYYAAQLYMNLRTDIEELLPNTARSVIDLNEVTSRLESTENLAVIVFSDNPVQSRRFVDDLAAELNQLPKDILASVEYRIDQELAFFMKRKALFLSIEDLQQASQFVDERIEYEAELRNPINIFRETELPEPRFGVDTIKDQYSSKISNYTRFPDGYYANEKQDKRVLILHLPGKLSGIGGAKALRQATDDAISKLDPKSYAPDLMVKFSGGAQNMIEEHASLLADLELSTLIVIVICSLALYIFFGSVRVTVALNTALIIGTLWAFGISYFAVGYLNANSAFLGAIVLGNGINPGIILLARFVEERRRHKDSWRAIYMSMTKTVTATVTASLAAGLAYGSLIYTGFRGFRQFGIIGLIGMVLCWIAAYTLLPAFLTLIERYAPAHSVVRRRPKNYVARFLAWVTAHHPKKVWAMTLLATLGSGWAYFTNTDQMIETDLSKLRDKRSMESGSGYLSIHLDEIFQRYMSPLVLLPRDRELTPKVVEKLKAKKEELGDLSFISAVYSIDDFIPKDQAKKIKILQEIKAKLTPRIVRHLSDERKKEIDDFLTPEALRPFGVEDLPELVRSKFRERDGTEGKLVLVEPPLTKELWDGGNLNRFVAILREAADSIRPGMAVAGTLPVTSDMYKAILRDGPLATLLAFSAVVILVVFLFRNLRTISLTLIALLFGVIWLGGAMYQWNLKVNFLNFIALPITFGIGVDYGVNIFQRYRIEGRGSILRVLRYTGGAVGLASLTTIVGYGSLLIAGNQAFVSFGRLAVLGELTCIFAALLSLPAFIHLMDQKTAKEVTPKSTDLGAIQ